MQEDLDVGLFAAEPGKPDFGPSKVIFMRKLPIHSGDQVLRLVADRPPRFAGVDPYNKLIDRNADDNTVRVSG